MAFFHDFLVEAFQTFLYENSSAGSVGLAFLSLFPFSDKDFALDRYQVPTRSNLDGSVVSPGTALTSSSLRLNTFPVSNFGSFS